MADPLQKRVYDVREYEVSLGAAIGSAESIASVTSVGVGARAGDGAYSVDSDFVISDIGATAGVVSFTCAGGQVGNEFLVRIRCALTGGVKRVEVIVPLHVQR